MSEITPESVAAGADEATSHAPQERYDALRGGRVRMGADAIADLAGISGRQVDRLRDAGVLPPAGGKGKRSYLSPSAVIRLLLIMGVKHAGASRSGLRQLTAYLDAQLMEGIMFSLGYGIEMYLVWDFRDLFDVLDMVEAEAFFKATTKPWLYLPINNVAEAAYRAMGRDRDASFLAAQRRRFADDLALSTAALVAARQGDRGDGADGFRQSDQARAQQPAAGDAVSVAAGATEISLPLWPPRLIKITGVARDGQPREWHLKTTQRGGLGLL